MATTLVKLLMKKFCLLRLTQNRCLNRKIFLFHKLIFVRYSEFHWTCSWCEIFMYMNRARGTISPWLRQVVSRCSEGRLNAIFGILRLYLCCWNVGIFCALVEHWLLIVRMSIRFKWSGCSVRSFILIELTSPYNVLIKMIIIYVAYVYVAVFCTSTHFSEIYILYSILLLSFYYKYI